MHRLANVAGRSDGGDRINRSRSDHLAAPHGATSWVVRAGRGSQHAAKFEQLSVIALSFPTVPSIAGWPRQEAVERVVELLDAPPAKALGYAGILYRFAHEIAVGDIVVTPDSERGQVLLGRVTGDYEYRESAPITGHCHVRRVAWIGRVAWDDLPLSVRRTVGAPLAVFRPGAQDAIIETVAAVSS